MSTEIAAASEEAPALKPWSVYLVECSDKSIYCGIAIDVEKRMRDHGTPRGARYVRGHGGVLRLLWKKEFSSRTRAMRAEIWIKEQTRAVKLKIVSGRMDVPEAALVGRKAS